MVRHSKATNIHTHTQAHTHTQTTNFVGVTSSKQNCLSTGSEGAGFTVQRRRSSTNDFGSSSFSLDWYTSWPVFWFNEKKRLCTTQEEKGT